jgi:hypothetical protein
VAILTALFPEPTHRRPDRTADPEARGRKATTVPSAVGRLHGSADNSSSPIATASSRTRSAIQARRLVAVSSQRRPVHSARVGRAVLGRSRRPRPEDQPSSGRRTARRGRPVGRDPEAEIRAAGMLVVRDAVECSAVGDLARRSVWRSPGTKRAVRSTAPVSGLVSNASIAKPNNAIIAVGTTSTREPAAVFIVSLWGTATTTPLSFRRPAEADRA